MSCKMCQQSPSLVGILLVNLPDMCLFNLWVKVTFWVSYSLQRWQNPVSGCKET